MNDEYQMKSTFENNCNKDGCIKTIIITDKDFKITNESLNKTGIKEHTINFTIKAPKTFAERLKEVEQERLNKKK